MLSCDGYKMFKGKARVTPKTDKVQPFDAEGTWLYKPEHGMWYCEPSEPILGTMYTRSFSPDILSDIREDVG